MQICDVENLVFNHLFTLIIYIWNKYTANKLYQKSRDLIRFYKSLVYMILFDDIMHVLFKYQFTILDIIFFIITYLHRKRNSCQIWFKSNHTYTLCDFIFSYIQFIILISKNLLKDREIAHSCNPSAALGRSVNGMIYRHLCTEHAV